MDIQMSNSDTLMSGANRSNGEHLNYVAPTYNKRAYNAEILENNKKSMVIMNNHDGDVRL